MPSSAHPLKPRKPVKPGKTSAASINKALKTAATPTALGTVKQGVAVAAAVGAAPTAAEYLALLTSLRNAGIIATA